MLLFVLGLFDAILPGQQSRLLHTLEPRFRRSVEAVLADLRRDGFSPRIAATYRDSERQELLFRFGELAERFGATPITAARAGQSCHNAVDAAGRPAALAADIVAGPERASLAAQAEFYNALGKSARRRGLAWGGAWSRRNPAWKRHGLGWDPAHIQARTCRR